MSVFANTGDITGKYYVGGIIGKGQTDSGSSIIKGSSSNADIVAEAYVGGIAGRVDLIIIEDCTNEGSTVTAKSYYLNGTAYEGYVGGYAGYAYTINTCENAVAISYEGQGSYVGGIAGRFNGSMSACKNTASITAVNSNYVGGLAGHVNRNGSITYQNLENSGIITGGSCVGGIFGKIDNKTSSWQNAYQVVMTRISNMGVVTADRNHAGGIVGYVDGNNTDSKTCYFTLTVISNTATVQGVDYVGGIFGQFYADGGSTLTGYTATGAVTTTGTGKNISMTVGYKQNLTLAE
jgi:hypothetical protein